MDLRSGPENLRPLGSHKAMHPGSDDYPFCLRPLGPLIAGATGFDGCLRPPALPLAPPGFDGCSSLLRQCTYLHDCPLHPGPRKAGLPVHDFPGHDGSYLGRMIQRGCLDQQRQGSCCQSITISVPSHGAVAQALCCA